MERTAIKTIELKRNSLSADDSRAYKLVLILRLARPRTWMFAVISYVFAYLNGSSQIPWQLVAGATLFSILTGATNMINAHTDIEEDRTNNPMRITWIERLGVKNLINVIIATYSIVLFLSLPFGPIFTSIVIIAIFDSVLYSLPPIRFKRHPITALIAFSGAIGLPYLAGLAAINELNLTDPWFILFTIFMLAYGTVKNVPDYLGDQIAGLKTTITAFSDFKKAMKVNTALLLSPYFLIVFLVGAGILSKLYLLNMVLMIFPIYWAFRNLRTNNRSELEKFHTYGFVYAISFFLFNLVLRFPSLTSMGIVLFVTSTISLTRKLNIDSRKE